MNDLKFPVLSITKNKEGKCIFMLLLDYPYLIADIRYLDKAYKKNITLIDSKGYVYKVNGIRKVSGIKFWESIK